MNTTALLVGLGIGTGLVLLLGSESDAGSSEFGVRLPRSGASGVRGMPVPRGYDVEYAPNGEVTYTVNADWSPSGTVSEALLTALPGLRPRSGQRVSAATPLAYSLQTQLDELWADRRAMLPADANPLQADRYSKELYLYRRTARAPALNARLDVGYLPGSVCVVDEFGRIAQCAQAANELPRLLLRLAGGLLRLLLRLVGRRGAAGRGGPVAG